MTTTTTDCNGDLTDDELRAIIAEETAKLWPQPVCPLYVRALQSRRTPRAVRARNGIGARKRSRGAGICACGAPLPWGLSRCSERCAAEANVAARLQVG